MNRSELDQQLKEDHMGDGHDEPSIEGETATEDALAEQDKQVTGHTVLSAPRKRKASTRKPRTKRVRKSQSQVAKKEIKLIPSRLSNDLVREAHVAVCDEINRLTVVRDELKKLM